jgi:hypothetical protein
MTIVLPIKFLILLIHTPIKLLSERSKHRPSTAAEVEGHKALELLDPTPRQWLSESVTSVTEQTTMNLSNSGASKNKAGLNTDPLEGGRA